MWRGLGCDSFETGEYEGESDLVFVFTGANMDNAPVSYVAPMRTLDSSSWISVQITYVPIDVRT